MNAVSLPAALELPRRIGLSVQFERKVADASAQELDLLRRALARHGVLCLVKQPLSPAELQGFVGRWGEVIVLPPGLALSNQEPGFASITRVGNVRPDGSIIPSVRFAEYWHHDGDFWLPGQNFIVNFLSCVRVPETGGNTGFLDMRLAYQSLSDSEKASLTGAHIWVRASEISDFKKAAPHELPPDARHPVLLPHPWTQEIALYLPDSLSGIEAGNGESIGKVQPLVELSAKRLGLYEHVWSEGDLVLMDNLQVMHRGMGGYGDSPRLLYRCQARLRGEG
jgi:taurine dioxygenase